MITLPIILASTSPRRHELLNQIQLPHSRLAVGIDETILPNETAVGYIERMVQQKAERAVIDLLAHSPNLVSLLITADTIGVLNNGKILLKPDNFDDAKQMWQQMSDNVHQVWTAVQVSLIQNQQIYHYQRQTVMTDVRFIPLNNQQMLDYWQTGEPQDKAGGYAIQGIGATWVKTIHGSYSNVVGLPLVETLALLQSVEQFFQTHS
ncbi:Maf family protein [Faucicola boevrei]|uniref:Maf family protein n=1 Tax=Faucicola boevrei TaxID=346665 RepID=UPI000363E361